MAVSISAGPSGDALAASNVGSAVSAPFGINDTRNTTTRCRASARPAGGIPAFAQVRLERRDVLLREICRALGRVECACGHRRRTEGRVEPAGHRLGLLGFCLGLRGLRRRRRRCRPRHLLVLLSLILPLRRRGRLGLGRRARRIRPDIRLGRHLRLRCLTDLVRRNNFDHNWILVRLCKRRRAGQCDGNPQQSVGNSRYGKRAAHEAAKPPNSKWARQFLARISPDGMASKHHNVSRWADRATFPAGETDLPLSATQITAATAVAYLRAGARQPGLIRSAVP